MSPRCGTLPRARPELTSTWCGYKDKRYGAAMTGWLGAGNFEEEFRGGVSPGEK